MQFKFFSIKEILDFIEKNNLAINKRFGQNFLINREIAEKIVESAEITEKSCVIEIGCGLGALTHLLLEKGKDLFAFEIDFAYIAHLKKLFSGYDKFKIIEGDFLKTFNGFKDKTDFSGYDKIIILGNLPYYITTPIIDKIFKSAIKFEKLIFMVQKEVAHRIEASPGSKKFGSISVFAQYYSKPAVILEVPSSAFFPKPKVDSSVVKFEFINERIKAENEQLFFNIVKTIFTGRRKQIKNNFLKSRFLNYIEKDKILAAFKESGIKENERGENLSVEKLIGLSNILNNYL